MSNLLSPEELRQIAERAEKATPGPWIYSFGHGIKVQTEKEPVIDEDVGVIRYTDAEFIASSRTDIPKLLAHASEQQRIIESLYTENDRLRIELSEPVFIFGKKRKEASE